MDSGAAAQEGGRRLALRQDNVDRELWKARYPGVGAALTVTVPRSRLGGLV